MHMQNIEQTDWARRFKAGAPYQYEEALGIAARLNWVVLEHRDDHSAKGDYLWAILPDCNPEFWLDALSTKEEAIAVCKAMSWKIKEETR